MQLIEHYEAPSAVSSIVFDDIPQTFTDLKLVFSGRSTTSATDTSAILAINGSTANLTARLLIGTGSSVVSLFVPDQPWSAGRFPGATATANTFSNNEIYFPNYTSSVAKSFSIDSVSEANATRALQTIQASLWNVTDAITSLTISASAGDLVQYSSATLYGILAGSDGTTTVS